MQSPDFMPSFCCSTAEADPGKDGEWYSIFPVENEALIYKNWERDIIWDAQVTILLLLTLLVVSEFSPCLWVLWLSVSALDDWVLSRMFVALILKLPDL